MEKWKVLSEETRKKRTFYKSEPQIFFRETMGWKFGWSLEFCSVVFERFGGFLVLFKLVN